MKKILSALSAGALITGVAFADDLQGEFINFTLENPETYPGTVRTVQVYVPKAYSSARPACLTVMMDGLLNSGLKVMDELAEQGKMPLCISVGLISGKISDARENIVRYNRSNEFDRMDDRMARFIMDEVIPEVCKRTTSSGDRIAISPKAADHAIMGGSSGGIAAFNAAFQRPDLFSRVYCWVGTFVPFRGGDQFPGLVRKTEPRPIRVYLQDNDRDSWNLTFGSWYEYNRIMESALEFAGYEAAFHWDEGGHSGSNAVKLFPDALQFIWDGWPQAPSRGKTENGTLNAVLDSESDWTELNVDIPENAYLAPYSPQEVLICGLKEAKTVSPSGKTATGLKTPVFDPYEAIYPGGAYVAIADPLSNWVKTAILGEDGSRDFEQEFYWLHCNGGQIAFDSEGYLYVATKMGVQLCDQNGRVRAILPLPYGEASSLAFADNNIFVISNNRLFVRKLLRSGVADAFKTPAPKSEGQG